MISHLWIKRGIAIETSDEHRQLIAIACPINNSIERAADNARLISCAPALKHALVNCYDYLGKQLPEDHPMLISIRSVLLRTEGPKPK